MNAYALRTVALAGLLILSVPDPSLATAAIDRETRPRSLTIVRSPPLGTSAATWAADIEVGIGATIPGVSRRPLKRQTQRR